MFYMFIYSKVFLLTGEVLCKQQKTNKLEKGKKFAEVKIYIRQLCYSH